MGAIKDWVKMFGYIFLFAFIIGMCYAVVKEGFFAGRWLMDLVIEWVMSWV